MDEFLKGSELGKQVRGAGGSHLGVAEHRLKGLCLVLDWEGLWVWVSTTCGHRRAPAVNTGQQHRKAHGQGSPWPWCQRE